MKPETLSTCSFLFTLWPDDVVSIDDDHWEICDVSNKDRLGHDKLMHDKGCEMGIVEFVVKFRVNDKPAVNARQRVVKRTPELSVYIIIGVCVFVWQCIFLKKPSQNSVICLILDELMAPPIPASIIPTHTSRSAVTTVVGVMARLEVNLTNVKKTRRLHVENKFCHGISFHLKLKVLVIKAV